MTFGNNISASLVRTVYSKAHNERTRTLSTDAAVRTIGITVLCRASNYRTTLSSVCDLLIIPYCVQRHQGHNGQVMSAEHLISMTDVIRTQVNSKAPLVGFSDTLGIVINVDGVMSVGKSSTPTISIDQLIQLVTINDIGLAGRKVACLVMPPQLILRQCLDLLTKAIPIVTAMAFGDFTPMDHQGSDHGVAAAVFELTGIRAGFLTGSRNWNGSYFFVTTNGCQMHVHRMQLSASDEGSILKVLPNVK